MKNMETEALLRNANCQCDACGAQPYLLEDIRRLKAELAAARAETGRAAHEAKWNERRRWADYYDGMVRLIDYGVAPGGGARTAFSAIAKSLREPDPTEDTSDSGKRR